MRSRVASVIRGSPRSARETVGCETPAARATSWLVGGRRPNSGIGMACAVLHTYARLRAGHQSGGARNAMTTFLKDPNPPTVEATDELQARVAGMLREIEAGGIDA